MNPQSPTPEMGDVPLSLLSGFFILKLTSNLLLNRFQDTASKNKQGDEICTLLTKGANPHAGEQKMVSAWQLFWQHLLDIGKIQFLNASFLYICQLHISFNDI